MSVIKSIRQELLRCFGLLKHCETAAEEVAHQRLGTLHDQLLVVEAGHVVLPLPILVELRDSAEKPFPSLDKIDAAIAETRAHAAALQKQRDREYAASQEAAARAALAVPKKEAPPAPQVEEPAPAPDDIHEAEPPPATGG